MTTTEETKPEGAAAPSASKPADAQPAQAAAPAGPPISEVHAEANRLNAKLASSTDSGLIAQARRTAQVLLDHVKSKVADFEDFKRRVDNSEYFSLTEARQVPKTERDLKVLYLRATSLLEAIAEAEERARRKQSKR